MSFGKRLRNLRENKGLTQEELGKIINQKKSNISKYENERLQPSMETINSFAEYFNVSIDYLFGRTDDPTPPTKQAKPNFEEYVLSALTLADAGIRIAELFNDYKIDEATFLELHRLAYNKFGLPPVKGAEKAAHLEHNIPAAGVFDEDGKDEDNY